MLREEHRKPQPGPAARSFLDELEMQGLSASSYNLPDRGDSNEGFRRCLDSLFQITPPSALILDEIFLFNLAQHHLARRGILAPERVSLVCADPDPTFEWTHPSVAHIRWDQQQVVKHIMRWADNVARGKEDRRQTLTKAEFIEGGTIGRWGTGARAEIQTLVGMEHASRQFPDPQAAEMDDGRVWDQPLRVQPSR